MSTIAERKETSSEIKENKVVFKVAKKPLKKEDQELSFEVLLKEIQLIKLNLENLYFLTQMN